MDFNYYKLLWDCGYWETASAKDYLEIKSLINSINTNRLILSGADSESAVSWALKLGLRQFQGYFIDSIINREIAKGKYFADEIGLSHLSH